MGCIKDQAFGKFSKPLCAKTPRAAPSPPGRDRMEFQKRKAAALAAINSPTPDKSPKGTVDAPIIPLLAAINSHPSYFTTSSCSGRISILSQPIASPSGPAPRKKARGGSWLFVSHDPVEPASIIRLLFPRHAEAAHQVELDDVDGGRESAVFRFEPLIIAVECENVEAAQSLVSLAISSGFRESGITSVSKRVIIAIRCSIRLEVPLGDTQKLMVSPEYIEYLVDVANEKMEANRKRTDLFYNKLIACGHGFCVNGETRNGVTEPFAEATKLEDLGISVKTGEEVTQEEVAFERKSDHNTDNGAMNVNDADLSVFEVTGEPVERLFLWGHSACVLDKEKVAVFGGFGGFGRHARRNDLLLIDTESGIVDVVCVARAPSPRLGHTSSVIGDFMYVIGGRAGPTNILNEVWVFSKAKKEWKLLQCSGSFFPPRHRHAAAVVDSKIYVFGGIHNDETLSSFYVLDTDTFEWTEIEIQGDHPGSHHSQSMCANGHMLYMFGGYNGEKALGDLHTFDIQTGLWSKPKTSGQSPNARFSHLMFLYSRYLGIIGGCPVSENKKLFLLDLQTLSWKNVTVNSIGESLFVRSTVSVVGDNLIIIGGGASCYAFGTKFSKPMMINVLQLMSICDDKESIPIGENHLHSSIEQKNGTPLHSPTRNAHTGKVDFDTQIEEHRGEIGGLAVAVPCVLQLEKQYAKLGKDLLKKFGWLDQERKVYSQADGMHICLPITEKFCSIFGDKKDLGHEALTVCQSIKPSQWQILLRDISSSEALKLILACRATKIVDEVVKLKKTPSSPYKIMKDAVATLLNRHGLPLELLEQLPSRWEQLGDITVLPVTSFEDERWSSISEELWPLITQSLGARRLARQGRVAQTGTRDSKLEILVGENGWVGHRENGILYSFDATKCMFSWGNLSEKLRIANLDCRDEVIVDLFAGIGYFVLPFLVRANAKKVYACEWNPHAIEALHHNLQTNSVADRCLVLEGDNRVTAPKGVADRVCLGLLPSSECSWVTAVRVLRDEGGMLHIHGNVKDREEVSWATHVVQSISSIAKSEGRNWKVSVEHVERVKWYAPHIRHLVADVKCCTLVSSGQPQMMS
ncbi:tRNA wybutosine-synthesizing protein 2/3/4 isoform X2 [Andrographis paniculata]|uniref:tRNA wybutosine-synthesizing protein 2/3/4 isoform X2 n=1 Tax=Andrographis paniculata TaxID=175694 RepID=UPI0021E8ACBD|nr:tRNA wybutosine-synthesizing protein 2/3/4 isoform X2 [Andrographis paniculata]